MSSVRILAIDAGRRTGWAFGPAGEMPTSGSFSCASPGGSRSAVFSGAGRWVTKFIQEHSPTVLVIEEPLAGSNAFGKTTKSTAAITNGIPAVLEFMAYQLGVFNQHRVNQSSVKKHFVGCGRGNQKLPIFKKCAALGWIPNDAEDCTFDRSDALAIWSYAEANLAPKLTQPVDDLFIQAQRNI